MQKLNNNELVSINGGSISGATLNYMAKLFTTIFDIGRALGSSIKRVQSDSLCPY